jgi:BlaI family transcriptional regulator, penicillinase repressor
MPRTPQDITDAELSVLQALWDFGTATVRELVVRLYSESTLSLNATVQKLLERLEAKKCVKRNRKVWPHQFSAVVQREALIMRQLQSTADKLCAGEIQPLISSLVKARGLTAEDRRSLRGLLDELDREKK